MNLTILLLLLFGALALVQTYRLRDAADSAKHYKKASENAALATAYWSKHYHAARDREDVYYPLLQVLEGRKLTPKKLRRILNAHLSNQYRRDKPKRHHMCARVIAARVMDNIYDRRKEYKSWRERKPEDNVPMHLGKDFLRRKITIMRNCNAISHLKTTTV